MIKTTLHIDGMACNMCESHINDVIRRTFRVKKVTSSHKKGTTEILSEEPIPEDSLREAINPTGYTVVSYFAEPHDGKRHLLFQR